MQTDPEDRYIEATSKSSGLPLGLMIGAVVIIAGIAIWYFNRSEPLAPPPEPAPVVVPAAPPEPELPPAPDIPEPAPVTVEPNEPTPEPEPPPSLETSDAELRALLAPAGNSELVEAALVNDNLIERGAAVVDSLSRGVMLHKLLPVPAPKGSFAVVETEGVITIDPESYGRYDDYAQAIEDLDTETLVDNFHRFRPLLEQTYAGLGYKPEDFDNALIRALDRIIDTPVIDAPIPVVKHEAVYRFADPELEQRPDLQKQLLRMGPDNIQRIQQQAQALRAALLTGTR